MLDYDPNALVRALKALAASEVEYLVAMSQVAQRDKEASAGFREPCEPQADTEYLLNLFLKG